METTRSLETRAQHLFCSVQDFTSRIFQMNGEITFTTQQHLLHIFHRKICFYERVLQIQLLLFLSLRTRSLNASMTIEKQTLESSSVSFRAQPQVVTVKHVFEVE